MKRSLKKEFREVCNSYVKLFCEAYELPYEEDVWVANEPGSIACLGDFFFDFLDVIKYCVDNNINDRGELFRWYDYSIQCHSLGISSINFQSWHKGCPRIDVERLDKLVKMKNDLLKEVKEIGGKDVEIDIY